jgi:hypothetical protein
MLLGDSIGIANQHIGPPAGSPERTVGDSEIVSDHVELGVSRVGKEHLGRTRDSNVVTVDDELYLLTGLARSPFAA